LSYQENVKLGIVFGYFNAALERCSLLSARVRIRRSDGSLCRNFFFYYKWKKCL